MIIFFKIYNDKNVFDNIYFIVGDFVDLLRYVWISGIG